MYNITIKSDSSSEPVASAVVRNFIKYDETDATEITLIDNMTKAARELLEKYLNLSLKQKTYQVSFDSFAIDDYHLRLPYGPLKTFTSLKFYDIERTAETLTLNTDYNLLGLLFQELYIPSVETDGYYVAEYESGYGTGTETIPAALTDAICELVKFWYDRGEMTRTIPEQIAAKVSPFSKQYWL